MNHDNAAFDTDLNDTLDVHDMMADWTSVDTDTDTDMDREALSACVEGRAMYIGLSDADYARAVGYATDAR